MARKRSEDYDDPVETVPGVGLPLWHSSLHHPLVEPAADEKPAKPVVRDWDARIDRMVDESAWGRENYGGQYRKYFDREQNWHYAPVEEFRKRFAIDELSRMVFRSCIMSDLSEWMANDPAVLPIHKVGNSMWQYGRSAKEDYGVTVRLCRGLGAFDFGVPGFTAHFDHTKWECGTEGDGRYGRKIVTMKDGKPRTVPIWLDGCFAYHVVRNNQIVLTLGFSLATNGVLVSQIQCAGKMRAVNIHPHLRDHVIDRFRAAWPGFPVRLITGATQKAYNKYTYRSTPQAYPDELADRVAAFYDAPLVKYQFGDVVGTGAGWGPRRDFRELVPVSAA